MESLAKHCPQLQRFKLEVCYSKRGSLVGADAALAQKGKVTVQVGHEALAQLVQADKMTHVHLSRLPGLDYASLSEAVASAPSLQSLALPHCHVNDEAVCQHLAVALSRAPALESVDLSCNDVTDEGCLALATALKSKESAASSKIKFLRLWGNVKISNHGYDAMDELLASSDCTLERVPLMATTGAKNRITNATTRTVTNQAA